MITHIAVRLIPHALHTTGTEREARERENYKRLLRRHAYEMS